MRPHLAEHSGVLPARIGAYGSNQFFVAAVALHAGYSSFFGLTTEMGSRRTTTKIRPHFGHENGSPLVVSKMRPHKHSTS
jgi:hypothetical protein